MIDRRTKRLFSPYDREVGNPARHRIRSFSAFEDFVALNNGVARDVFCSVYDRRLTINKLFIDLDGQLCMFALNKLLSYFWSLGEEPMVTFSGSKGFHIWSALIEEPGTSAKDLEHATLSLLWEAGVIDYVGGHSSGMPIDSTTIGDVRQMARIPNTLRPPANKLWCTWMPDTFLSWSPKRMYQWVQAPHYYNDYPEPKRTLSDYKTQDYDMLRDYMKEHLNAQTSVIISEYKSTDKESLVRYLSPFMAESIARSLVYDPEPPQKVRFIATKALLEHGFPPDLILQKFSQCGWIDFDAEYTAYQIHQINQKKYIDRHWWMKEDRK